MNQTEDTMVFKPHVQPAYMHSSLRVLTGFVVGPTPHGMVTGAEWSQEKQGDEITPIKEI